MDVTKPFNLFSDASDVGVCAFLMQDNDTVGIYSNKLTRAKTNSTMCEKEFLPVVKALNHFKNILYGRE